MKIVFFGTSSFGVPSLEALKKSSHPIQTIVTVPDKPKGRYLKVESSPIKDWAVQNKIPHLEAVCGRLDEIQPKLQALKPDLFIVISFGTILPESLLSVPKILALNVHSSLLPRYRGAAPIHWAIMNGDTQTGVSVIRMTPKLDAGDILIQKKTMILADDDILLLENRLSRMGAEALLEAISLLEQKRAVFQPQDESFVSIARKLTKEDGRIDWKLKAAEICQRIRAMKEWPTSYCFYKGKRVIVADAHPKKIDTVSQKQIEPGLILRASQSDQILVATGKDALEISRLQLEGKKVLAAKEFLRGFPLQEGQILE